MFCIVSLAYSYCFLEYEKLLPKLFQAILFWDFLAISSRSTLENEERPAFAGILQGAASDIDRFWGRILGGHRALPCNARNQTSSIITRPSKCNGGLCHCIASRYRIDNVGMRDSLVRIATTSDYRGASSTADDDDAISIEDTIRSAMRIRDIHNIRMS